MTDQNKDTQISRRNSFRAVTCCALCMVSFFFPLAKHRKVSSIEDSSLWIRKNFAKEAIAASNMTGADVRRRQRRRQDHGQHHSTHHHSVQLDFLVAGFAKCGTTSLLRTLEAHNETTVPRKEQCSLDKVDDDNTARAAILHSLQNASVQNKRGIKCPFSFTTPKSLTRLQEWFPSTKLIFGLRHPVKAFESYYNYRVSSFHLGKLQGPIPPAETLVGSKEWERVSTSTVQFERVFKQLKNGTKLKHPVFMYTLAQMDDAIENVALRKELGSFLELEHTIEPIAKFNVNPRVGARGHKETIDICDAKYNELRRILVTNGKKTQEWIRNEMLPYARVANRDGFEQLLKQWARDPCDGKKQKATRSINIR